MNVSDDLRHQLARALESLPRRKTATRRVAGFMDVIRDARDRGVEWAAIAEQLAVIGIARDDGRPLAVSTLALALRRLEERQRPTSTVRSTQSVAPSTKTPTARSAPAGEAEAFSIPEVDALFEIPADAPPAHTIDDLLKELNK